MPASRRARAMILAPRSCPSRPGLATTTRILRAVAASIRSGTLAVDGARLRQNTPMKWASARRARRPRAGIFIPDEPGGSTKTATEEEKTMRKGLEIGGVVATVVLVAFGIAAIVMGAG